MQRDLSDGVIAIRPLRLEDAAAHLAGEDAETVRWLSGGVSDVAGTRSWIERSARHWRDGGPTFVFGIWQISPRTLVGIIEANTDHRHLDAVPEDGANISYGLHSRARSRGYMPRALSLLEDFLRGLEVGVAVIRVDPENEASLRVPARSGYVFQETITSSQGDQLAIWHRRLDAPRGA